MPFRSLYAPLSKEEFFLHFWERAAFFDQVDNGAFRDLLCIQDLNEYFARNDLRYPCLRLVKDGIELPLSDYSKVLTFGDYKSSGLIQPDRLMDCYNAGATIVIQMAHVSISKLSRLAIDLENELDYNVQMTVYLTPPNSQGFSAHYDTHNVAIVQLSGTKTWKVYGFERQAPLLTDTFDQASFSPHLNGQEYSLTPGARLYIPRGMVHEASSNAAPSLHVTIGLFPPLWVDLFHDHLRILERDERFRRSPYWSNSFPKDRGSVQSELKELMTLFVEQFDFDMLSEEAANKSITGQNQNNENRLSDLIALQSANLESTFMVRSNVRIRCSVRDDYWLVRCFDKELRFNRHLEPAVSRILAATKPFRISDLDLKMNDESKFRLCIKLVHAGLLTLSP